MKKLFLGLLAFIGIFSLTSCEQLEGLLSNDETVAGLKQALVFSTDTSVFQTSALDGYFKNAAIKIVFPKEAENIQKILELPMVNTVGKPLLDGLELKMNRAAEKAAPVAKDIFVNAITNLTFTDAINILKGGDNAATLYLRKQADSTLYKAFYPEVDKAMKSVGADVAWQEVTTQYNTYGDNPVVSAAASVAGLNFAPVNTDISAYTTNKALDGLFHLIAEEEKKIRNDLSHRVTDLLQRVFKQQD